jgi:hypothetical protein
MRIGTSEPKAWAHRLKARELAGERLTMLQSKAWREALSLRGTKSDVDDTS